MFKEDKMIEAIRWILNLYEPSDYDAFDEEELCGDYGLCMHDVVMALRAEAKTVYQFKVDSSFEMGFKYRSPELFNQRAIRIYSETESSTSDNEMIASYSTELWLLEDMSFAVVRCVSVSHDDGVTYDSEYRTIIKKLEKREDLFFPPEELIDELEKDCIPIWESEAIIYEL